MSDKEGRINAPLRPGRARVAQPPPATTACGCVEAQLAAQATAKQMQPVEEAQGPCTAADLDATKCNKVRYRRRVIVEVYKQLVAERADDDRNGDRNGNRHDGALLMTQTDTADRNGNIDGAPLINKTDTAYGAPLINKTDTAGLKWDASRG